MIHVRELVYRYPRAESPSVSGLDFQVAAGEIFGFLGPSGAGKSTTQRILTGLLRDYQGEVRVLDRDLRSLGPDYYERIGVSFEVPNLYAKLSALENLRTFGALYRRRGRDPMELLDAVGLADEAGTRVGHYSKGMRVRLGVVRALLNRPELLFLDEPTAGLDPGNALRVKELVREARRAGSTVFLTTHDMSVADDLCDRVAFMVDGALACIDRPRTLKRVHGERTVRVEVPGPGDQLVTHDFALEGLGENPEFWDLLRSFPVETLHSQETSLEQVFLQVTGRALS